jgi:hypothetical protein
MTALRESDGYLVTLLNWAIVAIKILKQYAFEMSLWSLNSYPLYVIIFKGCKTEKKCFPQNRQKEYSVFATRNNLLQTRVKYLRPVLAHAVCVNTVLAIIRISYKSGDRTWDKGLHISKLHSRPKLLNVRYARQ